MQFVYGYVSRIVLEGTILSSGNPHHGLTFPTEKLFSPYAARIVLYSIELLVGEEEKERCFQAELWSVGGIAGRLAGPLPSPLPPAARGPPPARHAVRHCVTKQALLLLSRRHFSAGPSPPRRRPSSESAGLSTAGSPTATVSLLGKYSPRSVARQNNAIS